MSWQASGSYSDDNLSQTEKVGWIAKTNMRRTQNLVVGTTGGWFLLVTLGLQLVFSGSLSGAAFSDFDNPANDQGKFELGQNLNPPAPGITNDVPGGNNVMRLVWGSQLNISSLTYDLTDGGLFDRIEADFDFRVMGDADGFGFLLFDTAIYGQNEVVPRQGFQGVQVYQEPAGTNSLGIGFDIHKGTEGRIELNDNHLSVHFNNALLAEFDAGPVDLNSGQWIHAKIIARPGDGHSDVSVVLTPTNGSPHTVFTNYAVNGFAPYESRPHWGARSGNFLTNVVDLDNINVQFIDPAPVVFEFGFTNFATVEEVPAYVYVNKVGGNTAPVTVDFFTSNGSAVAGTDYVATNGTLTFGPDDIIHMIPIWITDNATANGAKTFNVTLTNAGAGTTLSTVTTVPVTIHDDDNRALVGEWEPMVINMPTNTTGGQSPIVPIHLNLLPNGKILLWDRHGAAFGGTDGHPQLWDPIAGTFTPTPQLSYDLFCAGHALMADGRLFVPGGHVNDGVGEDKAAIYDPKANTWSVLATNMNAGRWYPTATVLANGDILVEAGTIDIPTDVNPLPQIWQIASQTWRDLTTAGAQHGRFPIWANYYPFMYQAPNGKVFCAGPQQMARYLDISGTGNWEDVSASSLNYRDYGTSVMYGDGKVMITGGNPPETYDTISLLGTTSTIYPSRVTEVIDLNGTNPTWRVSTPMNIGRRHSTATLLPDGNVLMLGGSSSPGFNTSVGAARWAELWDPEAETWTPQAAAQRYNGYHCNALLLPDGRVVTTGGGHPNPPDVPAVAPNFGAEPTAEIYSPHYLFSGPRPTILSAPESVTYGETFFVETPEATNITDISWLRIGNTTHAFNQNQRISFLGFTNSSEGLWCEAPFDPHLTPPGHYMMFILTSNGVPSVASIIKIGMGIREMFPVGNDKEIHISTVPGNNYQLEYSDTVPAASWWPVGAPVTATNLTTIVTDVGGGTATNRFYQVRHVP